MRGSDDADYLLLDDLIEMEGGEEAMRFVWTASDRLTVICIALLHSSGAAQMRRDGVCTTLSLIQSLC